MRLLLGFLINIFFFIFSKINFYFFSVFFYFSENYFSKKKYFLISSKNKYFLDLFFQVRFQYVFSHSSNLFCNSPDLNIFLVSVPPPTYLPHTKTLGIVRCWSVFAVKQSITSRNCAEVNSLFFTLSSSSSFFVDCYELWL